MLFIKLLIEFYKLRLFVIMNFEFTFIYLLVMKMSIYDNIFFYKKMSKIFYYNIKKSVKFSFIWTTFFHEELTLYNWYFPLVLFGYLIYYKVMLYYNKISLIEVKYI